jgi:hypothetical protein
MFGHNEHQVDRNEWAWIIILCASFIEQKNTKEIF